MTKSVKKLSDGNRMKLMLAAVLSRDTELLIMDEPASPLDPLMREQLCDRMRDYLEEGDGERSIFFSTHNIADMENAADYAVFMDAGKIIEQGTHRSLLRQRGYYYSLYTRQFEEEQYSHIL